MDTCRKNKKEAQDEHVGQRWSMDTELERGTAHATWMPTAGWHRSFLSLKPSAQLGLSKFQGATATLVDNFTWRSCGSLRG